jgi:hypothetical protein
LIASMGLIRFGIFLHIGRDSKVPATNIEYVSYSVISTSD